MKEPETFGVRIMKIRLSLSHNLIHWSHYHWMKNS